jgi:DNA-binding MarR family transcriptional regulator
VSATQQSSSTPSHEGLGGRRIACSSVARSTPQAYDTEIAHLLYSLAERWNARLDCAAATVELSPPQSIFLFHLGVPRRMREIAELMRCDASNLTGIAQRLERRGLLERLADPRDARAVIVSLSPLGRETRQRLEEALYATDPLAPLTPADKARLANVLRRLVAVQSTTVPAEDDAPVAFRSVGRMSAFQPVPPISSGS